MKKSILNLGKALNRAEQKEISGGGLFDWDGPSYGGDGNLDGVYGFCHMDKAGGIWVRTLCNDLCANGTQPICPNP